MIDLEPVLAAMLVLAFLCIHLHYEFESIYNIIISAHYDLDNNKILRRMHYIRIRRKLGDDRTANAKSTS